MMWFGGGLRRVLPYVTCQYQFVFAKTLPRHDLLPGLLKHITTEESYVRTQYRMVGVLLCY